MLSLMSFVSPIIVAVQQVLETEVQLSSVNAILEGVVVSEELWADVGLSCMSFLIVLIVSIGRVLLSIVDITSHIVFYVDRSGSLLTTHLSFKYLFL